MNPDGTGRPGRWKVVASLPMRLVYFDFPGRGEAIRDALRIGAVPFEDERIGFEEFRARRAAGALPFDVLPVLVLDDGTVLSQSNTILRFVAARAGLVPADPIDALRVDELLDAAEDYGGRLSVSIRIQDEAVRAALRAELAQRWLPDGSRSSSAPSRPPVEAGSSAARSAWPT